MDNAITPIPQTVVSLLKLATINQPVNNQSIAMCATCGCGAKTNLRTTESGGSTADTESGKQLSHAVLLAVAKKPNNHSIQATLA